MRKELPPLRIGRLEAETNILLGGMSSGLTRSTIAGAVANEGGFGTIGGVGLGFSEKTRTHRDLVTYDASELRKEIHNALEISNDGNVGVNLMVAATDYDQSVKIAVEEGAKYIISGAGLPLSLPDLVDKYKVFGQQKPELIPIVSSARAAELIIKRWARNGVIPSAFVVETPNTAGGHLGVSNADDIGKNEYSLDSVIPQLIKSLENFGYDIPIVAAGGIWDRNDIDRMLKLGASGVQMATRFLATDECNASQTFKDRHINNTDPIVIMKSPVGMPGRAIENDFIRRLNDGEVIDSRPCINCLRVCEHKTNKLASFCIIRALYNVHEGDVENGILFTGSNGYQLKMDNKKGIHSTHQIMQELTGETDRSQEIISDYDSIKDLIRWMIDYPEASNPNLWARNRQFLNNLLFKHGLSPDDPDCYRKFKNKVDKASKNIK